jgi:hypothetical protein
MGYSLNFQAIFINCHLNTNNQETVYCFTTHLLNANTSYNYYLKNQGNRF